MNWTRSALCLLAVLAACSKNDTTPSNSGGQGANPAPAVVQKAPPKKPAQDEAQMQKAREALLAKKQELEVALRAQEKALDALYDSQAKEQRAFGDVFKLQLGRRRAIRDANDAASTLAYLEKQLTDLKKQFTDNLHGKLKELQDKKTELLKKLDGAISNRKTEAQLENAGAVVRSPVKVDLDTMQEVENEWLQLTMDLRAHHVDSTAKRKISTDFRAWLSKNPRRLRLVQDALKLPIAPKSSADAYDFSSLDFYVFCQVLEDELDKKNIEVERKVLAKTRKIVTDYENQVDAVQSQIDHLRGQEGGEALFEYEKTLNQAKFKRQMADFLQEQVNSWNNRLEPWNALKKKQAKELDAADAKKKEIQDQLRAVEAKLSAGG